METKREFQSIGWIRWEEDGPVRTEIHKNWYDKKNSATPAKIYKTKEVAERYSTVVKEVFVKC